MKLSAIIIFSLAVVLFVIGVHQTILYGVGNSYWIFMFSFGLLLLYQMRKQKEDDPAKKAMPRKKVKKQPSKR
ncbi:hypothetical protein QQ008_23915 [Fulvivirgaceae bacterium BMA10]|uniref:Uncharacterized protein n=1 Tax=Splendidivirga corallicola TaxID=3051826 RepID=A0ABT8KUN0_9BACT|nr:hypothetical protein [Fulvivirgaceae bacterium BMA10]